MKGEKVIKEIERNPEKYSKKYTDSKLSSKLSLFARRIGLETVIYVEILYYLMKAPTTPRGAKLKILAILGYVVAPIDLLPDMLPGIGFLDDIAAVSITISMVKITMKNYVTPSILKQAAASTKALFKKVPEEEIITLINKLNLYEQI